MKYLKIIAPFCMTLGLIIVLCSYFSVFAAKGNQSVAFSNKSAINLLLSQSQVSLGSIGFDGVSNVNGGDVALKSNKSWILQVQGPTYFISEDNKQISIRNLSVNIEKSGTVLGSVTLSDTPQTLISGSNINTSNLGSLMYSFTPQGGDYAGSYTATITYTLVIQ